jgi:hypothetical protein
VEFLWIVGGAVLVLVGVRRLKDACGLFFGGHPEVAVVRYLARGTMFALVGAVVVVSAWNVWTYG